MKTMYIAVAVIAGFALCYVIATNHYLHGHKEGHGDEIPEGFHLMEDGTLMKNVENMNEHEGETQREEKIVNPNQAVITIDPNARVFNVGGINHAFDIKEIKVKKGETVTINFESTDGFHDWVIDEFDAATEKVQPGTLTSVTFVADQAGTFEYYCSVGNHRAKGMVGNLIVE